MTDTVLYIVHSPPSTICDWGFDGLPIGVDKRTIHMAKIAKAIKFALKNDLPIIIESAGGPGRELDKFLLEQNLPEGRVKVVHTAEIDNPETAEPVFRGQKIERFIVTGYFKELCCLNAIKNLRRSFPDAEIIILRGDNSISWRNARLPSQFQVIKDGFKEKRRELDVKVRPLNRKLAI
ncbi:MAG: hypothetical protein ABID61_00015 [Candidatus Micrarchaeota archaeon]